ncbi:hypothetical protein GGI26_006414 [Coemansia sp. RSA 1358]|uniref:Uncharacterized protein n=1 Tax=Coemansia umbellata TaxID=1424467 RepID=A0ABQ8PCZ2_9FUNG|nr:hypothetical protein EDC05_006358 [Coemansia umbellata]KAJ2618696.1 hypothetical protein GGI26_006414 [Coemansia sp. RSA 1358]
MVSLYANLFIGASVGLVTGIYAVYIAGGAGVGYGAYSLKLWERRMIEKRRAKLIQEREKRLATEKLQGFETS